MTGGTLRHELQLRLERELPGATCAPLAGDASQRRFYRLALPDGSTRVLMDYGAPFSGETDDVRMTRIFEAAELAVAEIHAVWPDPGCLLLEDLGDRTLESELTRVVAAAGTAPALPLLALAARTAVGVAVRGTVALSNSDRAAGPALDSERFRFEMDFFLEHYVAGLKQIRTGIEELRTALRQLAELAADSPRRVLCHRDFHSRNLMLLEGGGLAMVDIQDARWGHDTYDLASLLRDAYVDIPEDWNEPFLEQFGSVVAPGDDPQALGRRFDHVSAQRMIKALGTFGYQATVLGRRSYLSSVPRTLARLERLLPRLDASLSLADRFSSAGLFDV